MPPKCTTATSFPAIQVKGCTMTGRAKGSKAAKEPAAAKAKSMSAPAAAKAKAPPAKELFDVQRLRQKIYKVALEIQAKQTILKQADRVMKRPRKSMSEEAPAKVEVTPLQRLQRNATRNILLLRGEMAAININKRVNAPLRRSTARRRGPK